MRMNARFATSRKRPLLALALTLGCLIPSLCVLRTALAAEDDDEEDSPQAGEALSSDELSKKRQAVLHAMPTEETILINVARRDMPASPDILNLGRKGTAALARCVSDNVDDGVRAMCARILGRLGDRRGLVALAGALEAWAPDVRLAAIEALKRMPDPASVVPLTKILNREDEEENNRGAALEALGAMSDPRAVVILREALRNPPESLASLRNSAFKGLWKSRHLAPRAKLLSDVAYALASGDAALILAATFAASEMRAPELEPALIKLMKHADTRIRNRAVYALGKIGDKAAANALLAQVPHVRESRMLNNIAFALERLDPAAFYVTARDLVMHKQAQIRMNTAFVIGDVHRPEGLPLLRGALDDKNDTVKLSAVTAIGKLDAKDAAAVLEKYVDDPNFTLKRAAIYAIYALSGNTRTDLVYDKLYMATKPPVSTEAAIALGRGGDPRVVGELLTCLELKRCAVADVDGFLRSSKSSQVPGRTLLAWTRGRTDLTDLVAALRPEGAKALARSEIQASLAHRNILRSESAIDLSGDLSDAESAEVLRPLLTHENARMRIHASIALSRVGVIEGDGVLFQAMDNLPQEQLPSLVRLLSRVAEPAARARLTPELLKREGGSDVPVALAAAGVRLAWDPEQAIFRMLGALGAPTRAERDLAEKYMVRNPKPIVTELVRRALAREQRPAVSDQLRRILDLRVDRAIGGGP